MYCALTASVLATSALFTAAAGSPIQARDVCGSAPTGSVAQTPLSQPTGITTASDCATQCKANSACLSFLFGMVNGVDTCKLYSVAASSLPPQTDLVAYDIGCSSIPSIVPTASNPTGVDQSGNNANGGGASTGTQGTGNNGAHRRQQPGQQQPTHANPQNMDPAGAAVLAQPQVSNLNACLAACNNNPSCVAYTFVSNTCKLFGPGSSKMARQQQQQQPTHANPQNMQPAGAAVLAQPQVADLNACLAACNSNPSCVAYTFVSNTCKLFGPGSTKMVRQSQFNHANPQNTVPSSNQSPIAEPQEDSLDACLAACQGNPSCVAYTFTSGQCKLFAAPAQKMAKRQSHAAPTNGVPAGNPTPIAQPQEDNLEACLNACNNNPSCVAYTFASGQCKLFA